MKNRMDKYGSIEPVIEDANIAMKITSPKNPEGAAEKKEARGTKTLMMTKQDLEYYSKLRTRDNEPMES